MNIQINVTLKELDQICMVFILEYFLVIVVYGKLLPFMQTDHSLVANYQRCILFLFYAYNLKFFCSFISQWYIL
jgi:hypothetical protein